MRIDDIGDDPSVIASERTQLQILVAKQDLYDNMVRYCRGMDRKDLALMQSTYWPDATEDHGMYVGTSQDFCAWAYERQKTASYKAMHFVTNVLVDIDGDQARRETAFLYLMVPGNGEPTDLLCGRYRDLCERRAGVWKVLRRMCVWDSAQRLGPEADFAELFGIPPTSNFGALFPRDPTYAPQW